MKLTLNPNEHLLLDGPANKYQKVGNKGGKLYLTNQRLVFIAHAFNLGSKFDEYQLSEIATKGNTFRFKTSTNLISFNIYIELKSGEEIGFVVTRNQKDLWIENIGQAILEFVSQTIAIPENATDTQHQQISNAVSQIKVVSCAGCGAYVVVMGGLATCEYCGRPTT